MKRFILVPALAVTLFQALPAAILPCNTGPLTTYLNGSQSYDCTLNSGAIKIGFNDNPLASYAGLSLLSSNNDAADPSDITVVPGVSSLSFEGSFSEGSLLASSQTELVQFMVTAGVPGTNLLTTTFHLINPETSAGDIGTGVAIGQELVCVGGAFTTLPVGLVTSVVNGVLGTNQFGCDGVVLIGTVGDSSGPLSALTGLLGLPSLAGVQDTATIQLAPYNASVIDVIKIQSLLSVLGGSASTAGFGDDFSASAAPEPGSAALLLGGITLAGLVMSRKRATGK